MYKQNLERQRFKQSAINTNKITNQTNNTNKITNQTLQFQSQQHKIEMK